jgi:hypothetical protein
VALFLCPDDVAAEAFDRGEDAGDAAGLLGVAEWDAAEADVATVPASWVLLETGWGANSA